MRRGISANYWVRELAQSVLDHPFPFCSRAYSVSMLRACIYEPSSQWKYAQQQQLSKFIAQSRSYFK